MSAVAPTLQAFFTDRLVRQRRVSPRTVASYRDTLQLLLCFVQVSTGKAPSALDWEDLDEPVISAFLDYLEAERGNAARTRTSASPPSVHCSAMQRCNIQSTLPRSNGCWRDRRNDSTNAW